MASIHREENVDEADRLAKLVATLGDVADELECPVVVSDSSTDPRTSQCRWYR